MSTFPIYRYIKEVEKGMSMATILFTYSPGGSIVSHHFIWSVPEDFDVKAAVTVNQEVIERLKGDLPIYHTRVNTENKT